MDCLVLKYDSLQQVHFIIRWIRIPDNTHVMASVFRNHLHANNGSVHTYAGFEKEGTNEWTCLPEKDYADWTYVLDVVDMRQSGISVSFGVFYPDAEGTLTSCEKIL